MMWQADRPRVFLGITEVASYYENLASGFAELGLPVSVVDLGGHPLTTSSREHSPRWIVTASMLLRRVRGGAGPGLSGRKMLWAVARQLVALAVMVWAIPRHDVFVFSWGTTFAHGRDLPILRRLGKTVVLSFHGTDARPAYLSPARQPLGPPNGERLARQARRTRAHVRRLEQGADHVICHPTCGQFLTRPMVLSVAIGLPFRAERAPSHRLPPRPGERLRVLHAPSNPMIKGTDRIRDAVEAVRSRGHDLDFIEISGQPHSIVLQELQRSDLVVDQAYSDSPMPGLSSEAAYFGVPTVVAGYGLAEIARRELDPTAPSPTVCCEPADLEQTIETLVTDHTARARIGEAATRFMLEVWSPQAVARRYLQVIEGRWPRALMRDPKDIRYVHGCGLSESQARAAIGAVVRHAGPGGLGVDDKPELRSALLRFARTEEQGADRSVVPVPNGHLGPPSP